MERGGSGGLERAKTLLDCLTDDQNLHVRYHQKVILEIEKDKLSRQGADRAPAGSMPSYTLHRIIWSDGRPSLHHEDYSVCEDGQAVGRIYGISSGLGPAGYVWSIYGQSDSGLAPTLDEAQAEWQAAYERKARYDLS